MRELDRGLDRVIGGLPVVVAIVSECQGEPGVTPFRHLFDNIRCQSQGLRRVAEGLVFTGEQEPGEAIDRVGRALVASGALAISSWARWRYAEASRALASSCPSLALPAERREQYQCPHAEGREPLFLLARRSGELLGPFVVGREAIGEGLDESLDGRGCLDGATGTRLHSTIFQWVWK